MKISFTNGYSKACKHLLTVVLFLGMTNGLFAQMTCPYTIELFDSFGDGWNGAELTVISDGEETTFTLETGDFATATFLVTDGADVILSFEPGFFPTETSFEVFDADGNSVFSAVGPIPNGELYNEIGVCPSCLRPFDAAMTDVNANNADLSWTVYDGYSGSYVVEYDTLGFSLGTGQTINVPYPGNTVTLTNLAENTTYEVYVFLDCGPDSSVVAGPLEFHTLWLNDIGVTNITSPTDESCTLGANETITIEMTNFGQIPQTLFDFFFAVNGQIASIPMPQDGFFTGVIGNDSTQSISFETTWDFSAPDFYVLEAWTQLEGDSFPANDTFRIEISTAFQKPIQEDFEDGTINADWLSNSGFIYGPNSHSNETWVWGANLWAFNTTASLTTEVVGPVVEGDSLTFDYRFVNFGFLNDTIGTELGPGDMLEVQISDDCGETFETVRTIDFNTHITTNQMTNQFFLLDDYDGMAIVVRFQGTWGNGDYWLDLDNINVTGCPITFGLLGEITGTLPGEANGSITVEPSFGIAPFTYEWDNGETTETISDLEPGQYSLTVTDANGCVDFETYEVGSLVSADEVAGVEQILLFPNPTSGRTTLDVTLTEAMDFQVRVFNLNGQVIFEREKSGVMQVREEFDLSSQPDGMYLLQVIANGKPHYAKLMVAR